MMEENMNSVSAEEIDVLRFELEESISFFNFITELMSESVRVRNRVDLSRLFLKGFGESLEVSRGIFVRPKKGKLEVVSSYGFEDEQVFTSSPEGRGSLAWNVFDLGTSILVDDIGSDSRFEVDEFFKLEEPMSAIAHCLGGEPADGVLLYYLPVSSNRHLRGLLDRLNRLVSILEPHYLAQLERFTVEEERELVKEQFFHTQKLASVGILSAGIAHEIRNPLAIIKGNVGLIKKLMPSPEAKDHERCMKAVESISSATLRMQKIVKGLGSFARTKDEYCDAVSVKGAVLECADMLEDLFRKLDVSIETNLPEDDLLIQGNVGRLEQVIINLVGNAKDALGDRGGTIKIGLTQDSGFAVLTISDDGCGMSPDVAERIFDPFFTTKDSGKGMGLGMGIVRSILESLHGRISFTTQEGEGATFTVHLPLS